MTIAIDGPRAVELLEQVVEGREDYVYVTPDGLLAGTRDPRTYDPVICFYRNEDGGPSCIVGQVVSLAGGPAALRDLVENASIADIDLQPRVLGGVLALDDMARMVLSEAQVKQDNGKTWGEALQAARECLSYLSASV